MQKNEKTEKAEKIEKNKKIAQYGEIIGINTTGELLDPRYDYCFKRIFTASEEQSKTALIDFLDSILFGGEEKIKDLTIINNELPAETYRQKKARFDTRIVFVNGEQALVGMEFKTKDNFFKRSLHNISRMYSSQEVNGLSGSLKKCYMIGIMGHNLFEGEGFGYINEFTLKDKNGREYKELSEMRIVYIEPEKTAKFLEKPVGDLTNAEAWGLFLRYASYDDKREVLEKIAEKTSGIKIAIDILTNISKDALERIRYEDELLTEIDRQAEIDFAVKKAQKEERQKAQEEERRKAYDEKLEMAKEMLADGEQLSKIIKYTKLTTKEIEKIL